MAKKLQKTKRKPMDPRTKNILVNSFKGIISNQACIDNGKEAPWWLAILFFLFAIIIPLIPNFVYLSNSYGASFLNNGTFGVDTGLAKASIQLKKDNKSFEVKNGLLSYSDYDATTDNVDDIQPIYSNIRTVDSSAHVQYDFQLYYTQMEGDKLSIFVDKLTKVQYVINTTDKYVPSEDPDAEKPKLYIPSFAVLSNKTLAVAIYKSNTTTLASNTFGGLNWNHTPNTPNLLDRIVNNIKDEQYLTDGVVDLTKINLDTLSTIATKNTFDVWKGIFNETYIDQKETTKWNNTLIFLGVYGGLLIFLGLLVFLLTRGKNSPFRSLNFWVCQKIAYFLSFTPAVLALVVGFIMSTNMIGQMMFIMFLSLRVMWASMRQLRPAN